MSEALYIDLQQVAARHMEDITGREFQRACLDVANGYWSEDELGAYVDAVDLAKALAAELAKHPIV